MSALLCCQLTCLFLLAFLANPAHSQENKHAIASARKTQQIISQTSAPREELRFFENLKGRWNLKDANPTSRASGHLKFSPISLGYFVNEELDFGGGNLGFMVHGVYGFDPLNNRFTGTWYTSFNSVAFMGTAKPSTTHLEFLIRHPMFEPATEDPRSELKFLYRITPMDSNQLKLQLVSVDLDDKEVVQIDIIATRADDHFHTQPRD